MLQLTDLSLRRGDNLLFSGANLQLNPGQKLGLTGANGSGKSSLFDAILGNLEPDTGGISLPPSCQVAHVEQESPDSSRSALDYVLDGDRELRVIEARLQELAGMETTADQHDAWDRLHAIDGYTAPSRAAGLLHGLGFADASMNQPVNSFSGGWRMRLNLAQALMCRSDLLLLDEPTNHLDLPAILWLENWLSRYAGMLMLISHDRDFLDRVCNRIARIEQNRLTLYTGNYSQFETMRSEQLAQQQAMYRKQQREIAHIQSYVDRFRYKASKARQAQSRLKMLARMTEIAPAHVDSPFHFEIPCPEKQPAHLLQLSDVGAGYTAGRPVLTGVNVHIGAGDRWGLLGVNGAGKSTLVKALADGSTVLGGERVVHRDARIGYFTQHQLERLRPELSPMDHLREQFPGEREQDLRNFLGGFGFTDNRIFDPVAPFSGGEKARLVLALLIRLRPNLLLLDEPTNHLDLEMRQALALALGEYEGALVVISHDRHLLRTVCDELLLVHDGKVDEFDLSVDDYPAWLAQQEARPSAAVAPESASSKPPPKSQGRREQRQQDARRRAELKPLSDRVQKTDRELAKVRHELEQLEKRLADSNLYVEASRKAELNQLLVEQGRLRDSISALEWDWLEATEALEAAQQSTA